MMLELGETNNVGSGYYDRYHKRKMHNINPKNPCGDCMYRVTCFSN
jgi:hypothetical protein